jgi:hypothetical protein
MAAPDLVPVKCICCDVPLSYPASILKSMKLPAVFCDRCWGQYDFKTLRQWFKLDMMIRHLQHVEGRLNEVTGTRHTG